MVISRKKTVIKNGGSDGGMGEEVDDGGSDGGMGEEVDDGGRGRGRME